MRGNLNQNLKENFGLNSPIISAFRGLHLTRVLCLQLAVIDMHGQAEKLEHVLSRLCSEYGRPREARFPSPLAFGLHTPHTFLLHKKVKLKDKKPFPGCLLLSSYVHITYS